MDSEILNLVVTLPMIFLMESNKIEETEYNIFFQLYCNIIEIEENEIV